MVYFGITLANTFFVIGFLLKDFENGEKYFDFLDMYTYHDRELIPFNLLCLGVAFISSLVAICVCAFLNLDVSMGIGTIFGIYCAGNVSAKFAHKDKKENENNGKWKEL